MPPGALAVRSQAASAPPFSERACEDAWHRRRFVAGISMTVYGYAGVSTDGQTLAAQDAQLHTAGCAKIDAEKVSGAKTAKTGRAELGKLLKRLAGCGKTGSRAVSNRILFM
jgi:hypothetical protein